MHDPESPAPVPSTNPKPGHGPTGLGLDPRDKPNLIDGRLLIFGSALGCVVLFFIVWGSLRSVQQHVQDSQPQLNWAARAAWYAPAVIRVTLVKPNAANAQYTYNKPRYRDPGLVISEKEEKFILGMADIARNVGFKDPAWRQIIQVEENFTKNNFYAQYLLATISQMQNEPLMAEKAFQKSFDLAPKVIAVRYTDTEGQPIQGLTLDRIEIGCDRVTDDGAALDQRLVLVFPHQTTDKAGRVYLPVYDTTYRPVYLPQVDGYDITYAPDEGWFNLPTRLGVITAVITQIP